MSNAPITCEAVERLPSAIPSKPDATCPPPSTRGRGRTVARAADPAERVVVVEQATLCFGDALDQYPRWEPPAVIVSDGGYGVLGFDGDTADHRGLRGWYEAHVRAWSKCARPDTTLWFWNSEIGWAAVHPLLEECGWRYVECNIWNKGIAHIAGNVNTATMRRFPVVTEVCAMYVREVRVRGLLLKEWLLAEWTRTGLPRRSANDACGVKDAATRKYLDQGHLWYHPPAEAFEKLVAYANEHGDPAGRPYFSMDGSRPLRGEEWERMRGHFTCPHGWTNVWDRLPVQGRERIVAPTGRAAHLNQKPLDLMRLIISASSREDDVVWEPFGGLFSASIAASHARRRAFGAEIDAAYFELGVQRARAELSQQSLL